MSDSIKLRRLKQMRLANLEKELLDNTLKGYDHYVFINERGKAQLVSNEGRWVVEHIKTAIVKFNYQVDETKKKGQEQGAKAIETDPFAAAKQNHLTDVDCRKGVNVDKPECIEYFNRISRTGESVGVAYNPSKPYEDSEIQDNLTYQVTAKPVFSGCMKTGSKYQAYTQQGTKLDVSQADCERLIQDNDRPFNYFASSSKEQIKGFDQANDKSIANNAL